MLLLTNEDVRQVLTMEECYEAIEESTLRVGRGQLTKWEEGRQIEQKGGFGREGTAYSLRTRPVFDLVDGLAILRVSSYTNIEGKSFGVSRHEIITIAGGRTSHPTEQSAWLLLFEMSTGRLLSIIQDRDIQAMRVGCVGGLCAKYMARADAHTIGLIGSGWMARTLLMGHCLVRDIRSVKVYSPNPKNRAAYCEQMKGQLGIEVTPASSAEEVVRGADIVISATNGIGATFDPEWLEQGTHVYCVTGSEYDRRMCEKADRIAWTFPESDKYDSKSDDTKIIGDPQKAKEASRKIGYAGYRTSGLKLLEEYASKRVYLTDIMEGRVLGRNNEKEITLSPSPAAGSSIIIRFAVLVPRVYEEAKRRDIGHDLPDEWFHQQTETYPMYRLKKG